MPRLSVLHQEAMLGILVVDLARRSSEVKGESSRTASSVKESVARLDGIVDCVGADLVVHLP